MEMEKNAYYDFNKCSEYEKNNQAIQDVFYQKLGAKNIQRVVYENSEAERKIQKQDIDLYLCNNKDIKYSVSEKNRTGNYGDLLFEIYSMYEYDKYGWSITGQSDVVFYFVNDRKNPYVGMFLTKDLHKIIQDCDIKGKVTKENWDCLLKSKSTKIPFNIEFPKLNKTEQCFLIKARNKDYTTMNIAIPYSIIDGYGCKYKMFDWNGNILKNPKWKS